LDDKETSSDSVLGVFESDLLDLEELDSSDKVRPPPMTDVEASDNRNSIAVFNSARV
jgi:hypothetical protein